jgi:hypothetical protein
LQNKLPAQRRPNRLSPSFARSNKGVETATLHADAGFLQNFYASDFRFSHGTGVVANKSETLKALQPDFYISRDLDLKEVEPHGDVALTIGQILVRILRDAPCSEW